MGIGQDAAYAVTLPWYRRLWRQSPAATVLIVVVVVGQVVALAAGGVRPWIVGASILLLDALGAAASWRAGGRSPTGSLPWRLIGCGRAASVITTLCLFAAASGASRVWWWAGTLTRLPMFVLLAAGVLAAGFRQYAGRARWALFAEVTLIWSAGFMLTWYAALEPVLERGHPSSAWLSSIGWPLGDLLLLAAAASVVLRGAVTRFTAPITLFAAGLALFVAADVTWSTIEDAGQEAAASPLAGPGAVLAALLLSVGPLLAAARARRPFRPRVSGPPAWATHLPMAAMLAGSLLMLAVTLIEGELLPWGGLVGGLIVMTCAAALRQALSLRESQDQVVTDRLTGLANRTGLDRALDRITRRGEPAAVLLIDLDGFKLINDAYGHAAGDAFLEHIARQLKNTVRDNSLAARIGGDEFVLLLPGTAGDAAGVAQRILSSLAMVPVRLDDDVVPVRASIGVADNNGGQDATTLLRHADIAMYHSKRAGSHGHTVYDPTLVDRRADDAALAEDLEHALARGQLHVLYQPMVQLNSGRTVGAEALLRWQHPRRGLISPLRFIPIAERTGTINTIGLWVLEQALRQMTALNRRTGAEPLYMSVNLSPRQLREPAIVPEILGVLHRTGTDPRHLVLEVTESAVVDDSGEIAALQALRDQGIRIAIDDFGTGYSSLQYLTRLPVDILKIDRSFVAELNDTAQGAAVTQAVIRLAQVLHLTTVAEGIETDAQAAELRHLGCDTGQGYLYAKPLGPDELARLLASPAAPTTPQATADVHSDRPQ